MAERGYKEMNARTMTSEQIRHTGLEALIRELGSAGTVRFLQQFEIGQGDYSQERHGWLGKWSVQKLAEEIRKKRNET